MRTLTSAQTQVTTQGEWAVHVRVFIDKDGTNNMTDITSIDGRDWLESVELRDGVDDNGLTARITVRREEFNLSMATLMQDSKLNQQPIGSYVPFITIARNVRVETAVLPPNQAPVSTDWINSFQGQIDDIDWGGDSPVITLSCRDQSAFLQDRWVENNTVYGTSDGRAVETVMQDILDEWAPGVTLYCPVSPAWVLLPWEQEKQPVYDTLRKLAQQIGWDVKYRWDSGSSAWRLTLYLPDRAKVVPDFTFGTDDVNSVTQLRISKMYIRNRIRVVYTDSTTGDRTTVIVEDATSKTKYGTMFMEVAEAATSQIDTSAEATAMGNAMLSDLKEPNAEMAVEVLGFPFAETGDLYRFTANNKHFSVDQDSAVVAWSTSFNRDRTITTINLRGKPSGAFIRWLGLEARPGLNPGTDTDGPAQPANVDAIAKAGGLEISYDMPTDPDWSYSEVHASQTAGFTPTLLTKVADGRSNKFFINSLEAGYTYYIKIIAVDTRGNRSLASTQIAKATALTGPAAANLDTMPANLVPNGDFGVWSPPNTPDTTPPDKWKTFSSDGSTFVDHPEFWNGDTNANDTVWYDTTRSEQGGYAVRVRKALTGTYSFIGIQHTELFPVEPNQLYERSATVQFDTPKDMILGFRFFQRDKVTSAGSHLTVGTPPVGGRTWYRSTNAANSPSTAAFCRAELFTDNTGALTDIYLDRIELRRALPTFLLTQSGAGLSITASTWTNAGLDTSVYDNGNHASIGNSTSPANNSKFTAPFDGDYAFAGSVSVTALATTAQLKAGLWVNDVETRIGNTTPGPTSGGVNAIISVPSLQLVQGDTVKLMIWHNDSVSRTENGNAAGSIQYFSGACVRHA